MPIEDIKQDDIDDTIGKLEKSFIIICYIVGIGSILYGALSGVKYGAYFVPIGFSALLLVIYHAAVRAAKYNEKQIPVYLNIDVGFLIILFMIFFVGLFATDGKIFVADIILLIGTGALIIRTIKIKNKIKNNNIQ